MSWGRRFEGGLFAEILGFFLAIWMPIWYPLSHYLCGHGLVSAPRIFEPASENADRYADFPEFTQRRDPR